MGLRTKVASDSESRPVFIEGDNHKIMDFPGGGTLDKTGLADGIVLPKGTYVSFDEATRKFIVLKVAQVYEAATDTATAYKIKKGSGFATSDVISAVVGGKSYAISGAIDTSNADYDVINVGTTLGVALTPGQTIFHSAASGATAGALKYSPNGLLRDNLLVEDNAFCGVVWGGMVYNRRLPAPATAEIKAALKFIHFSEQR